MIYDALTQRIAELESILVAVIEQYCPFIPDDGSVRYSSSDMSSGNRAFDYLVNHGLAVRAGCDIIFAPASKQQQLNRLASCGLPKQGAGANRSNDLEGE